jgi:photosystem II stability/assembly factor-like uncharacterized protein
MQQNSPGGGQPTRGSFRKGWPAIGFALLVAAGAVYSFTPRPLPDFPETQLQAGQLLINGLARSGDHFVAGGAKGRILIADSADGPWRNADASSDTGSAITRLLTVDDRTLFAVGHNLLIQRSEDGGLTWQRVHEDLDIPEPLLDIAVTADGERLIAVGGFGQYLVSDDGGENWQSHRHEVFNGSHLNDLAVADDGTLLLAAERGLVLRSRDRGESWEALDVDYPGSMFGALPLGGERWIVFGMEGKVFETRDHGDSWAEVDSGVEDTLFGGTQLADGRVVLVGGMQRVLVAEPDTFDFRVVQPSKQGNYATVLGAGDSRVIVGGEPGARLIDLSPQTSNNKGEG